MAEVKAKVKAVAVKPVAKVAAKPVEKEAVKPAVKEEVKETAKTPAATAKKTTAKKAPAKKAAAEKKAPAAKKTTAKKAPAKKAPAKRTAAKKEAVKAIVNLQFSGKSYTEDDLIKIAKDVWKYDLGNKSADFKSVELYVKPEESRAYYVINGETTGSFAI